VIYQNRALIGGDGPLYVMADNGEGGFVATDVPLTEVILFAENWDDLISPDFWSFVASKDNSQFAYNQTPEQMKASALADARNMFEILWQYGGANTYAARSLDYLLGGASQAYRDYIDLLRQGRVNNQNEAASAAARAEFNATVSYLFVFFSAGLSALFAPAADAAVAAPIMDTVAAPTVDAFAYTAPAVETVSAPLLDTVAAPGFFSTLSGAVSSAFGNAAQSLAVSAVVAAVAPAHATPAAPGPQAPLELQPAPGAVGVPGLTAKLAPALAALIVVAFLLRMA